MRIIRSIFAAISAVIISTSVSAQSSNFNLGRNLDIQYSILKNLSASYVDTLDFDKIIPAGISAMLSSLDPYTTYIPESAEADFELLTTGAYGGIGAIIRKTVDGGVIIDEPYEGSPAAKAGLEPGDTIWEVDGRTVVGETSEQATSRMKGMPGTDVVFHVVKARTGDTVDIRVKRERIHVSDISCSGILRDSIGFIGVSGFTDKVSEDFRKAYIALRNRGAKRLVIDLRDNGGGLMDESVKLLSLFVPKGTMVVSSRGREERMNNQHYTETEPIDTEMPILVMVNSQTASSSEIVTGALQDLDRAVVAGGRTFGKGLIQSVVDTPFDGKLKLTTGKYYTPSGRCLQAIDYSHRNEDGSVGMIPDSLRHTFYTLHGRTVQDGGGITPDIKVEGREYSRPVVALYYSQIPQQYAIEYYRTHTQIAPADEFAMSDEEYEEFVQWASQRDFDFRSSAETLIAQLRKAIEADGLKDSYGSDVEELASRFKLDKITLLRLLKDDIRPLIEQEIVTRYYYSAAGNWFAVKTDTQLSKALDRWLSGEVTLIPDNNQNK